MVRRVEIGYWCSEYQDLIIVEPFIPEEVEEMLISGMKDTSTRCYLDKVLVETTKQ